MRAVPYLLENGRPDMIQVLQTSPKGYFCFALEQTQKLKTSQKAVSNGAFVVWSAVTRMVGHMAVSARAGKAASLHKGQHSLRIFKIQHS